MGQGGPVTGGAQGRITIDTSQLAAARAAVNAFATGTNTTLTGINSSIVKTQNSFAGLASAARQVAGAFGISFGVAGAVQLGKAAIAATEVATAYNRQAVAARNLAGSQGKLNSLLEVYGEATGGAVDDATALANVTKLMSVGFADNAGELDKFATAIRGISIAMGTSQDTVTQNLILELFTQRGARLDQLGLQYATVRARADELQAADSSLTQQMAYQNAVLEQANQRFGKLADSAEGAATGLEQAGKAAKNAQLSIGQVIGPGVNVAAAIYAGWLQRQTDLLMGEARAAQDLYAALQRLGGVNVPTGMAQRFIAGSAGRDASRHSRPAAAPDLTNSPEAQAIRLDWSQGIVDLEKQTHDDIIDEETSFGQSRAKTVADYARSVTRAEEDFGRQRLRENLDQLDAIQGVLRDATRREQSAAADLARSMAKSRSDSAEREVEIREDATKRLSELDANYEKERIKRAKDLSDDLLDAAGQLDAKQVYELQRNAAKQEEEAKEQHDDARQKIQAGLDERLDDERKSLDKSIHQQQEAYDRQIEQGREADRLRLEDMADDFTKRKAREDEDHTIQASRRAEDQAAQLAEMDTQHGLRLNQIRTHAIEERAALQEAADEALVEAQAADDATRKRQEAKEKHLEELWDKFHNHIGATLGETAPRTLPGGPVRAYASGGYVPNTGLAFLHSGEYVMPRSAVAAMSSTHNSRAVTVAPGAIVIQGTGMDADAIASRVIGRLTDYLEAA